MKRFMILGLLLAILATPVLSFAADPNWPFPINQAADAARGGK